MEDIDFLNIFYNIVFGNKSAYLRALCRSYDNFTSFLGWLKKQNIPCENLELIDEERYNIFLQSQEPNLPMYTELIDELERLSSQYKDDLHLLYIPGFHEANILDKPYEHTEGIHFFALQSIFRKKDLSFFDPFPAFLCAMTHADLWPGILVFNKTQQVFIATGSKEDVKTIITEAKEGKDLFDKYQKYHEDSYFLQLSDLHVGKSKHDKGLAQLYTSLDETLSYLPSPKPIKVIMTGDLMNSPTRKNMYIASDFLHYLKRVYNANVTFVLGNHDVVVRGFNVARKQKSKVIAYLLGERIKILEDEKIILIKMDTTSEGNFARGKVGKRQLDEISEELSRVKNREDYTCIALLHHHIYPITKNQFIKTSWHEKTFINRIIETSKVLVDAKEVLEWIEKEDIQYIFHGHKHLPFFRKKNGRYYIASGSATGGLKESKSRYISYNVAKYNLLEKKIKVCLIFYDDKAKAERQRVEVYLLEENNNEISG